MRWWPACCRGSRWSTATSSPRPPIDRIAAGAGAGIDVMVGTNTDDWQTVPGPRWRDRPGHRRDPDRAVAATAISRGGLWAAGRSDARRLSRRTSRRQTPATCSRLIQTDWWCRIPAIRLADAHAKSPAATYMYEFAWRSPQFDGRLGACHALEIAFVFDTLDKGPNQMLGPLLGIDPPQPLATAIWFCDASTSTYCCPGFVDILCYC